VAIQPNHKIVAAGFTGAGDDFALARYNLDGSLDTSFDGDGKVTTDFGGLDGALGVAIQPDRKIVAAGFTGDDFSLARYNLDGSLDTSFGGDGKVTTDFGGFDQAFEVAIQPNGSVVAAGFTGDDFALARYNRDGSLDRASTATARSPPTSVRRTRPWGWRSSPTARSWQPGSPRMTSPSLGTTATVASTRASTSTARSPPTSEARPTWPLG
jgi:uncharacterized delta-60 repeat protein